MRLGGFVIHGNDVKTLSRCLKSLQSVCDQVVAVDSFSTDGSLDLVKSLGVPFIQLRWQGYGAARAAAAKALALCDYLFYLDSDEYLLEEAVDRIRSWALSGPQSSVYLVKRRNHVDLDGHRFVFHTDTRARLIRRDAANWTASMIVHESLPRRDKQRGKNIVEHFFASSIADRLAKDEQYALLWAIRARATGKPQKPIWLERAAHFVSDLLFRGALFRGGVDAVRLASAVSRYHARKYKYLRELSSE